MIKHIGPREFLEWRQGGADITLLDVREDWEVKLSPVPSTTLHIPMGEVSDRWRELDPAKETVVICRSGGRSGQVAHFLDRQAFRSVYNLEGGILAWGEELDPSIVQY